MIKFNHLFHLVTNSPWPLITSLRVIFRILGVLNLFHNNLIILVTLGNLMLIIVLIQWWRDVIRERLFQGFHSRCVIEGLRLGILLFIISELFFFISFFWTYFHIFLSPTFRIGIVCPSYSLERFNPYNIPLLNTLILLSSGVSITWCHNIILNKKLKKKIIRLLITLILGLVFTFFQYIEYIDSFFTIRDSIYGSIFFIATGFHGLHVLIGTIFIFIIYMRINNNQLRFYHHFGFEAASWYWHFVDVVWLFLYIFIYWLSY